MCICILGSSRDSLYTQRKETKYARGLCRGADLKGKASMKEEPVCPDKQSGTSSLSPCSQANGKARVTRFPIHYSPETCDWSVLVAIRFLEVQARILQVQVHHLKDNHQVLLSKAQMKRLLHLQVANSMTAVSNSTNMQTFQCQKPKRTRYLRLKQPPCSCQPF
jgi:hypothetical protein